MKRSDARNTHFAIRKVKLIPDYLKYAEGSCLVEWGNNRVVCSASVENRVPSFLKGQGSGWVSAEYGMLPRSCKERVQRDGARGRVNGRHLEIQRLVGRSLRTVTDLRALGERTVWIDCDCIQADGGTRCASITGSFVALALALKKLKEQGRIQKIPLSDYVAAVSVGVVRGESMLDLNYEEDSSAWVDMNVVMTGNGRFIEIQGTAEREPFDKKQMNKLINLASRGIKKVVSVQRKTLGNLTLPPA